jgi:probable F420-dependent oxidoreductase
MKYGLQFPAGTIGSNPTAIKEWARAAESLGYAHLTTFEHIVSVPPGTGERTHRAEHHELLTLYAFLAGVTDRIGLLTAVLVLPLRQAVVVAKQAAEIDTLSNGRLRLGVSVGRVEREYDATATDYHTRGKKFEEQIDLMRKLWTQEWVSYDGRFHKHGEIGIVPPPVQQPIPIWMGGASAPVLNRIGRIGDGWLSTKLDGAADAFQRIRQAAFDAGRDPNDIQMEGRLEVAGKTPEEWLEGVHDWSQAGATLLTIRGDGNVPGDLDLAQRVKETLQQANLWTES